MARPVAGAACSLDDFDRDVGRVGHDVVHGRAFLRLRHERLDVFLRRVGIDLEGDLDVVVAVAHVAVDAEDAVEIHLPFELRLHRAQLYAAVLRNRGHTRREAARETDQHQLDWRRAVVLGSEHLGVIGLERELRPVLLLVPEPMEALDGRCGVGPVPPLAGRTPGEFGGLGRVLQCFPCGQQCVDVDAVFDIRFSHLPLSSMRWKALYVAFARVQSQPDYASIRRATTGGTTRQAIFRLYVYKELRPGRYAAEPQLEPSAAEAYDSALHRITGEARPWNSHVVSASRPARSMPASVRIRTPVPARYRSFRRRVMSSRIRPPPPPTSTCRNTATPTRGS